MCVGPNGGRARLCKLTHWVSSPGTDSVKSLTMKKFVSHTTCHDSLGLEENETYLIMGQTSDLWRVKSECVGRGVLCYTKDSDLGSLPDPSPVFDVKTSTVPVNRSLGGVPIVAPW